jgi:hypothetical protein
MWAQKILFRRQLTALAPLTENALVRCIHNGFIPGYGKSSHFLVVVGLASSEYLFEIEAVATKADA